jgi:hypothetical protein
MDKEDEKLWTFFLFFYLNIIIIDIMGNWEWEMGNGE